MSRLRIVVDSNLEELFLVSLTIRAICQYIGLDEAQTSELDLCAIEAATNAIKHAYHRESGHEVSVALSFDSDRLELEVCDAGASMPAEHRDRLRHDSGVLGFDPADLTGIPEGGMGLEIIRRTMDHAEYSSCGGQNCLRLTKFLRKGARA